MNFSVDPKTFATMKIETSQGQTDFLFKLSQFLSQVQGAINGSLMVFGSELTLTASALGTVSTNQTVNCANACAVMISYTASASMTLTLSNLQVGIPVVIKAASTGAFTLKFAATTPAGTTYAITGVTTAGATQSLVTTGLIFTGAATNMLAGNSVTEVSTPTLYLLI